MWLDVVAPMVWYNSKTSDHFIKHQSGYGLKMIKCLLKCRLSGVGWALRPQILLQKTYRILQHIFRLFFYLNFKQAHKNPACHIYPHYRLLHSAVGIPGKTGRKDGSSLRGSYQPTNYHPRDPASPPPPRATFSQTDSCGALCRTSD